MNIVLFEPHELTQALPADDERATHILKVLRRVPGDTFDVGQIDGPRGKATLVEKSAAGLTLQWDWEPPHAPPPSTRLGIGFPRPQTGRDILRDATSLGATELAFIRTARSDPNYPSSSLWHSEEWRRHAVKGAAQAFDTHLPQVGHAESLAETLDRWQASGVHLLALDVHEAPLPLSTYDLPSPDHDVAVLLGPERGWDEKDRQLLRARNVPSYQLGERVLRTETAVIAALTLINAARARAGK